MCAVLAFAVSLFDRQGFNYTPQVWRDDRVMLAAWQRGATGFPLVDAGMRQLWATGWMQQSVRMVCAAFLTEYLSISWVSELHTAELRPRRLHFEARMVAAFSGTSCIRFILKATHDRCGCGFAGCCQVTCVIHERVCRGSATKIMRRCAGGGLSVVPRHAGGRGPGDQLDDVAERRQGGPGSVELHPPADQPLAGESLDIEILNNDDCRDQLQCRVCIAAARGTAKPVVCLRALKALEQLASQACSVKGRHTPKAVAGRGRTRTEATFGSGCRSWRSCPTSTCTRRGRRRRRRWRPPELCWARRTQSASPAKTCRCAPPRQLYQAEWRSSLDRVLPRFRLSVRSAVGLELYVIAAGHHGSDLLRAQPSGAAQAKRRGDQGGEASTQGCVLGRRWLRSHRCT